MITNLCSRDIFVQCHAVEHVQYFFYLLVFSYVVWTVFQLLPKCIGSVVPPTIMLRGDTFATFGIGCCSEEKRSRYRISAIGKIW